MDRNLALSLAKLEFNSELRCDHVGWLYLFHWVGAPL